MYISLYISTGGHDPPPCHTYIYIDKNTDQYLAALTTISCLLSHLHGSLTCAFTMHHKQAAHDSQRLTHSLWHHSESTDTGHIQQSLYEAYTELLQRRIGHTSEARMDRYVY